MTISLVRHVVAGFYSLVVVGSVAPSTATERNIKGLARHPVPEDNAGNMELETLEMVPGFPSA